MTSTHSTGHDEGRKPADARRAGQLSKGILDEIGLVDLPDSFKEDLLQALVSQLEHEVGARIVAQLDSAELDEFEELIDEGDEEAAMSWLSAHVANHADITRQELERRKAEVAALAPTILSRFSGSRPLRTEESS